MNKHPLLKNKLKFMPLTENDRLKARIIELEEELRGCKQIIADAHPIVMKHHSDLLAGILDNLEKG